MVIQYIYTVLRLPLPAYINSVHCRILLYIHRNFNLTVLFVQKLTFGYIFLYFFNKESPYRSIKFKLSDSSNLSKNAYDLNTDQQFNHSLPTLSPPLFSGLLKPFLNEPQAGIEN